jgi:hypothetical protein
MEVAMTAWLVIGTIFAVMLVLAVFVDRTRVIAARSGEGGDPAEDRRRKDEVATFAARMVDARTPPHSGGYPV